MSTLACDLERISYIFAISSCEILVGDINESLKFVFSLLMGAITGMPLEGILFAAGLLVRE